MLFRHRLSDEFKLPDDACLHNIQTLEIINKMKHVKLPDKIHTIVYSEHFRYKSNNEFSNDQYSFNFEIDHDTASQNNIHTIIFELHFGRKFSEIMFQIIYILSLYRITLMKISMILYFQIVLILLNLYSHLIRILII